MKNISENNRIEYKAQLTEHLEKEVVAFLNYIGGGIIYIGIADDGSAVGVEHIDQIQLKIKDRLKKTLCHHVWVCLMLWRKREITKVSLQ